MTNEFFRLPSAHGMLNFNVADEAQKLYTLVTNDPQQQPTRCNDEDLKSFAFEPSDIGFLILLLPGQKATNGDNFTFLLADNKGEEAMLFLRKLRVQQFKEGLLLATTACSWDTALERISHIDSVCYMAVAFTTPLLFQVIAEDPKQIR